MDGVLIESGAALNFGEVLQLTPATKTITVRNAGLPPLQVGLPGLVNGAYYDLAGWTGGQLAAGQSQTFTVTLDTSRFGEGVQDFADLLQFTTTDNDELNFKLNLAGTVSSSRIVDDSDPEAFRLHSRRGAGAGFSEVVRDTRFNNGTYRYHAEGAGRHDVQWVFSNLTPGESFEIAAAWAGGGSGRAPDAPFSVIVATGSDEASVAAGQTVIAQNVDQRVAPAGPTGWHSFGLVTLAAGQNTIVLQLTDDAAGYVIADAARISVPQPLHAAGPAAQQPAGNGGAALLAESIQPVLGQAIAAWESTGLSPADVHLLYQTKVVVADLPGRSWAWVRV